MIVLEFGLAAVLAFVLLVVALHSWLEMRFDKKACDVFDIDGTRTDEELSIIHKNQLPIRGLLIVCMTLAADMRSLLPTLALLGVGLTLFWIIFDLFCAVFWLDKPWYYAGEPPPYGLNPVLYFMIKVFLFSICFYAYINFD